jgi:hypothetical protein
MHISRSSSTVATPLLWKVCFIRLVARALNPGTLVVIICGMGQLMLWKPSGPKGIFIGMAGLPTGVTIEVSFGFSRVSPKKVKKTPTSHPIAPAALARMNGVGPIERAFAGDQASRLRIGIGFCHFKSPYCLN